MDCKNELDKDCFEEVLTELKKGLKDYCKKTCHSKEYSWVYMTHGMFGMVGSEYKDLGVYDRFEKWRNESFNWKG